MTSFVTEEMNSTDEISDYSSDSTTMNLSGTSSIL